MTTKTKWIIGGIAVLAIAYLTKDKWMPSITGTTTKPEEPKSNARGSRAGAKDDGLTCYYGKCKTPSGSIGCWDKTKTSCS